MLTSMLLIDVGVFIFGQNPVFAYTDPGSGTLILQMLLAAAFGVMFYVRRIIGWFRRLMSDKEKAESANAFAVESEKESESVKS